MTSTFPTFHLLLFCVITALSGALSNRKTGEMDRGAGGPRKRRTKGGKKRNSKTNYFLNSEVRQASEVSAVWTHRQPDGQMDRWATPAPAPPPRSTNQPGQQQRGSAESHTHKSNQVCSCESFKILLIVFNREECASAC